MEPPSGKPKKSFCLAELKRGPSREVLEGAARDLYEAGCPFLDGLTSYDREVLGRDVVGNELYRFLIGDPPIKFAAIMELPDEWSWEQVREEFRRRVLKHRPRLVPLETGKRW